MSQKREFVLGMLIGSAVGAAVALLYAPQGGSDTRDLIRQKGVEAKDKVTGVATNVKQTVGEKAGQARATAGQWVDRTRGAVETKKEQAVAAWDAAKQAARDKQSELQRKVEESTEASTSSSSGNHGRETG
jgi:gas vesicle protein